jgi:ComF family protein
VDAVVAVPLHALRRYERGYNQAELIARPVAQALAKPLVAGALKRTRGTDRQARLSALERRKNVEDAFEVRARGSEAIKGKKLLLVDDVMTTGATFGAAARALKKSGARAVYGAIAARAALGDDA